MRTLSFSLSKMKGTYYKLLALYKFQSHENFERDLAKLDSKVLAGIVVELYDRIYKVELEAQDLRDQINSKTVLNVGGQL